MDELTAISRARQLHGEGTPAIPVDVYGLVTTLGFEVRENDQLAAGEAGSLIHKQGRKIIVLNAHDHPYRKRFTVLHELAHDCLGLPSVHGTALAADGLERVCGRPREEVLCDVFAAECLVPWKAIQPLTQQMPFTSQVITNLSHQFEASKQCIASRFAQCSQELVAYVLAEDGIVRNAISSKPLRESGVWIRVGVNLPTTSVAADLLRRGAGLATESDASDWSDSDPAIDFVCTEEALHPGLSGQTISLLCFERVGRASIGSAFATSHEDEELLSELTGKLPWPKR
jgi:hypothetical protein